MLFVTPILHKLPQMNSVINPRATHPENHRRYISEGVYGCDLAWHDATLTSMGEGSREVGSWGH
jgi:hypothetical protein